MLYARVAGVRIVPHGRSRRPRPSFSAIFLLVSPASELVLPSGRRLGRGRRGGTGRAGGDGGVRRALGRARCSTAGSGSTQRATLTSPQLAARSTWYRNATTVDYATSRAVPGRCSPGTHPSASSLPIAADHPRNLFTLLGARYTLRRAGSTSRGCARESLCRRARRSPRETGCDSLVDDLSVVSLHLVAPEDLEDGLPGRGRHVRGLRRPRHRSGRLELAGEPGGPQRGSSGTSSARIRDGPGARRSTSSTWPSPTAVAVPALRSAVRRPTSRAVPGLEGSRWERRFLARSRRAISATCFSSATWTGWSAADRSASRGSASGSDALVVVAADHGVSFRAGPPAPAADREHTRRHRQRAAVRQGPRAATRAASTTRPRGRSTSCRRSPINWASVPAGASTADHWRAASAGGVRSPCWPATGSPPGSPLSRRRCRPRWTVGSRCSVPGPARSPSVPTRAW